MRDRKSGEPFEIQWFHQEWIDALGDPDHPQTLIVAPRSHGKTELAVVARVVWELGRNPNLIIKIVCEDDSLSHKRLKAIRRHIEHNPKVKEVFPNLRPDRTEAWASTQLFVEREIIDKDPSVEAKGIFSGSTGSRCDLLIADDVCGKRNALLVPSNRAKVKLSFYEDWLNLCDPDSRVWYICTLWHKDDLSHELMKSSEWNVLFYAVGKNYESIWPDRWPAWALRARAATIGSTAFARGYHNVCRADEDLIVREEWLRYIDLEVLPPAQELVFFTSYDTAKSTQPGADYTAEVVVAVHEPTERIYVVDARHGRVSRAEQSEWVWRSFGRFKPFKILIEDIGADLAAWVEHDHPKLIGKVEAIKPTIGKEHRLLAVTPFLERGEVFFSSRLNPDDPRFRAGRGSLIGELLDFPVGEHDDLVDAFSQALDGARFYLLDHWTGRNATLAASITNLGEE